MMHWHQDLQVLSSSTQVINKYAECIVDLYKHTVIFKNRREVPSFLRIPLSA